MRFAQPHFLWLLLVFPPGMLLFYWWAWRQRQQLMQQFIQARLLPGLTTGLSPKRQKLRMGCLIAGVIFLILALARPQWGYAWEEVKQRGLDIVVAIDTSKSMLATDIAPNRLARAKLATLDLLRLAKSDRLGLVAFAGTAFLQCPLTIDETSFRQSLDALNVNIIPQGGTAIAEAIDTALAAFKEKNNFKVLVLFTDGDDHDSGALAAAERAAQAGMRIFTVGIGTAEGELLRIKNERGQEDYVRDEQGNVVKSRLNESLLQQIAGTTDGGFYLPLHGAKVMETLYDRGLAPLPKSEGREKFVRRYHERYHWPLALALLLFVVEILCPETKRPRRKSGVGASAVATGDPVATTAVLLFCLASGALASPANALRDYNAGKFENALKEYQRLIGVQKNKDDPRLHFNAGTAAYRATNYDVAMKEFSIAARASDVKLQQAAYFNLGNTQFRMGDQANDLDALQQAWEAAIKSYQSAVALDKQDADAGFNLEFVKQAVEQIKLMREMALRARESADQEFKRRNYRGARQIMESLLQQNLAAKPFEDFAKKLMEIDEIANPSQPQP